MLLDSGEGHPEEVEFDARAATDDLEVVVEDRVRIAVADHDPAGIETLTHHPDSGAPIDGAVLPRWDAIGGTALRAAVSMPMNCYVGWDLYLDPAGRIIIGEASGSTGVGIYQVHRGLLSDPAVRRFFEEAGVL